MRSSNSAQLERAKVLKAAIAAPHQLAAFSRRFVEPPTSYGSLYDQSAVPISSSVYSYDPGVPLVASASRYTYADARMLERFYSFGGTRTFERFRASRHLVATRFASRFSSSTFDTVAVSLLALAAPVATSQASHAAPQVATSSYSAPTFQSPPVATQPTPPSHLVEGFGGNCPSSSSGSTESKSGFALPPGGPLDNPDKNSDKKKRDKHIDNKRKGKFLIDSTALKAAKGRTRGSMNCEVERYERGTDLNIKGWINQMETFFTIRQVPHEAFVGFMLMKIVYRRLNEINQY